MGMYDHVKFDIKCKKCGEIVTDFQTKDGECMLESLIPSDDRIEQFYSTCSHCNSECTVEKLKTTGEYIVITHNIKDDSPHIYAVDKYITSPNGKLEKFKETYSK